MIEGVEILSMRQSYDWVLLATSIVYLILSISNLIIVCKEKYSRPFIFFCLIVLFFGVIFLFGFFNSNYIEYEVTIDDNVSFIEFTEKYEILEKNGNIYTIKEIVENEEAR